MLSQVHHLRFLKHDFLPLRVISSISIMIDFLLPNLLSLYLYLFCSSFVLLLVLPNTLVMHFGCLCFVFMLLIYVLYCSGVWFSLPLFFCLLVLFVWACFGPWYCVGQLSVFVPCLVCFICMPPWMFLLCCLLLMTDCFTFDLLSDY